MSSNPPSNRTYLYRFKSVMNMKYFAPRISTTAPMANHAVWRSPKGGASRQINIIPNPDSNDIMGRRYGSVSGKFLRSLEWIRNVIANQMTNPNQWDTRYSTLQERSRAAGERLSMTASKKRLPAAAKISRLSILWLEGRWYFTEMEKLSGR